MNFSSFDKPEYRNIPIYDVIKESTANPQVYIVKYFLDKDKQFHRHKGFQINYIYEGKVTHIINENEFEYTRGDISIILPYVPHKIIIDSSCKKAQIIEFDFISEFISQNLSDQAEKEFFDFTQLHKLNRSVSLCGSTQERVEYLLNKAVREFSNKQPGYSLMVKSILLKLLVLMRREFSIQNNASTAGSAYQKHKETLNYALKYIEENYNRCISIDDVSKAVSYSPSYFSRLFRLATSNSFTEYLIDFRIRKAMGLLKDSNMQILEIAHKVGFNNVCYFNKLFKAKTGLSPRQFRKGKEHR